MSIGKAKPGAFVHFSTLVLVFRIFGTCGIAALPTLPTTQVSKQVFIKPFGSKLAQELF
jgi:hypothetical protein